ncbi:type VI secretion system tube protein TssD [Tunicatimonas pelagia]|uniref:type VI secretion system tube protein TssD n=1 Tax=Tunicatimonas pelagia TaxID=931531 RepID=UPI0026666655|nr:type VI secretion system tube protein TssD [Tunicatimonas pelagia]WKN41297.1 type VI secretion system tube protein TssD [Tunicatimonas pelagia]
MAVRARLDLDKLNDVRVIDFSYSFSRDIDASGRPSGIVRGGTLQMTIESTKSAFLPTWMTLAQGKTKEGQIEIMDDTDDEKPIKTIKFKDAYIVEYGENFSWQGGENMMETFVISCREITIEGDGGPAVYENEWPM